MEIGGETPPKTAIVCEIEYGIGYEMEYEMKYELETMTQLFKSRTWWMSQRS